MLFCWCSKKYPQNCQQNSKQKQLLEDFSCLGFAALNILKWQQACKQNKMEKYIYLLKMLQTQVGKYQSSVLNSLRITQICFPVLQCGLLPGII